MSLIPPDSKQDDLGVEPEDTTTQVLVPEVIRSEVNFLVLPFFALWDKDVKRKTRTEYKTQIRRGEQRLEISWIVSSNPEFGYPGPFDKTVHKAIEQIIGELPPPIQNPIPLGSLYGLCKKMGIGTFGGSQYRRIKEALTRIVATTIVSKGAFYSREKEGWVEDVFHLYERVVFKGEKLLNSEVADTNYVFLNSWYLDNINNRYVKPIDWPYYRLLRIPIAQRLYELLSIKFYGLLMRKGGAISYRYSTLCELLPVARQRYHSDARKLLEPAHRKLRETQFLADWDWEELPQKEEENDWLIRYYPGERAKKEIKRFSMGEQLELELPQSKPEEVMKDEVELSPDKSGVAEQLMERGITKATAAKLVKAYPIEQVQRQMEVFDWLRERKSELVGKNPAGFLRKSIEENYQPPEEYHGHREREAREEKQRDRRERWLRHREEMINQGISDWDKTPAEERVKGMLEFWIAGEKINTRPPTQSQIEFRKQELIDNLPDTHEEKREYLSLDYPEDPPGDFG